MKTLSLAVLMALAACSPQVVYRDRPVTVNVPVAQPCVDGERPAPVIPLKEQYSMEQWNALDVKQKAAIVGRQGLARQTYGEKLDAATGACP